MGSYDDSPPVKELNLNGPGFPIRLEPLRANGWLHDMKVSSPTASPMNNDISGTLFNPVYRAWIKKYPSALNVFDKIVACGRGKKIALFLDYDGTLSPIVDEPDNAVMSDQMRENYTMLVAMEWTLWVQWGNLVVLLTIEAAPTPTRARR